MDTEQHEYLKSIRLKVAPTTYNRKRWQIGAWFRFLGEAGKSFTVADREDVTRFLLSFDCTHAFRCSLRAVVRECYLFHRMPDPGSGLKLQNNTTRSLPMVPGRSCIDELSGKLAGNEDNLCTRDHLIFELAYGSGLRRDELRRANIDDLDFKEKTLRVTGKGNKTRIVPLTSDALDTARLYLSRRRVTRGPLLVSNKNKRLSCGGIYLILHDRLGIRPHLLRHACATHMLENGASLRTIQELLGHKDLRSTQIYTQVEKNSLRTIVSSHHPRAQKSSGN
jgi:site-specific recombinase XerD